MLLRAGAVRNVAVAMQAPQGFTAHPRHRFWPADLDYSEVRLTGILGHRQIIDAYLAELSRQHGGKLATFDQGLAALHAVIAMAVPT